MQRDVARRGAARAIDEDGRADDDRTGPPHRVDRLLNGSAGRHDVVDDENALSRSELEPAPELPAATVLNALGVDRPQLHLPRDLMREDDAAGRRSCDRARREGPCPRRDVGAQGSGAHGPLEHLELLEVTRRVPSRREDEVSLAEGAGFTEDELDL